VLKVHYDSCGASLRESLRLMTNPGLQAPPKESLRDKPNYKQPAVQNIARIIKKILADNKN